MDMASPETGAAKSYTERKSQQILTFLSLASTLMKVILELCELLSVLEHILELLLISLSASKNIMHCVLVISTIYVAQCLK